MKKSREEGGLGASKDVYKYIYIPGSSKCVDFMPFHQKKNLPKGQNFYISRRPGYISEMPLIGPIWFILSVYSASNSSRH